MNIIYLDWAATSIPDTNIIEEMGSTALLKYGNPSSIHLKGIEASGILENSRAAIASALNIEKKDFIFTSGGTESNNLILYSLLRKFSLESILKKRPRIILSGIEHSSCYEPAKFLEEMGFSLKYINTEKLGTADIESLKKYLNPNTVLVSLIFVNNETGVVQPVEKLTCTVKEYAESIGRFIHVHTDAVQALGKISLNLKQLGIDSASFSAHKIRGPRGIGGLFIKDRKKITPLYTGGGQENGLRHGTENLPAIYGFAKAVEKYIPLIETNLKKIKLIKQNFLKEIKKLKNAVIIPEPANGLPEESFSPYILNVAFPPIPSEVTVRALS
ncbi:MAG: cysteine desulfurase, partial [Spirochaetales bacterium]|nr:cysteine desulfurase [Spirochaetales bacterium]